MRCLLFVFGRPRSDPRTHRGKRWTLSTPGAHRSNGREFELAQIINFYEASEFSGEVVGQG